MKKDREKQAEVKVVKLGRYFYPFRYAEIQKANYSGIISKEFQLDGVGKAYVVLSYAEVEPPFPLATLDRHGGRTVLHDVSSDPLLKVIVEFDLMRKAFALKCKLSLDNIQVESMPTGKEVHGGRDVLYFKRWKKEDSSDERGIVLWVGQRSSDKHYDYGLLNDLKICFER